MASVTCVEVDLADKEEMVPGDGMDCVTVEPRFLRFLIAGASKMPPVMPPDRGGHLLVEAPRRSAAQAA